MPEAQKDIDPKKYVNTNDILDLLHFIYTKKRATISEINELPKYKRYISKLSVKALEDKKSPALKNRDRIRQVDLGLLMKPERSFVISVDSDYAFIDYSKEKLTDLQKELSKLYLIELTPQEANILHTISSEDFLNLRLLQSVKDFKEHLTSLSTKKETFGYSNITDKKFLELCQIGVTLRRAELTDTVIKDIIYRLNYEIDSKYIKEFKEFIKLKNPSVVFKL